jgi:hypothetical protein
VPGSGAIAQLGERLNGIQEVVGSIPIGSTKIPRKINGLTIHARRGTFAEKVIKSYKEKSTPRRRNSMIALPMPAIVRSLRQPLKTVATYR